MLEEENDERDDKQAGGRSGERERDDEFCCEHTHDMRARTKHTHTQGVVSCALFVVGPHVPKHGDRYGRHVRHGIQGRLLCKLSEMVFQAQVLLLLPRRLRGSLGARCKSSRTHSI